MYPSLRNCGTSNKSGAVEAIGCYRSADVYSDFVSVSGYPCWDVRHPFPLIFLRSEVELRLNRHGRREAFGFPEGARDLSNVRYIGAAARKCYDLAVPRVATVSGICLLGRRLPTTLTGDDALLPSNRYCSGRIPIISKSAFYIRRITNGSGFYRPFYDRVRVKSELASYELVDAIRGSPQLMSPRMIYRGMVNNDLPIPTYAITGGAFYQKSEWYMYTLNTSGSIFKVAELESALDSASIV
ncbi:hypothetical protein EV421DRAFT_1742369 [Armillaria borealis]|uniref:Uncharacterized protein n=1 Tax=Armillaria borealis TaxID=47425 RepID=A0AA39IXP8_9AGAR|nr:hypothetical protein EV421DRAFT_1742369 [Armillaria borealis]